MPPSGKNKGRGRRKKEKEPKENTAVPNKEPEELTKAAHSFVIYRGRLGKNAMDLLLDFRRMMQPYTASKLKVQRKNVVKDFVAVAGLLNVTHLVIFTKTEIAMYMKIIRLPRGPTMTFRIHNFALARDIVSALKKPVSYSKQFEHHPLLVLNSFSGEGMHIKLMTSMFQNMFPSINVAKVKLDSIRRCLLLNYNPNTKLIDLRHYTIKVAPIGMSRPVKKLVQSKIPDLSRYNDISEFIAKPGNLSESEAELDDVDNKVVLPQNLASRGNMANQQSAVRLVELGPRLTIQLVKIEENLLGGEVLYHDLIKKTEEEKKRLLKKRRQKSKLKLKRKQEQMENVQKKEQKKAEHREKSLKGIQRKEKQNDDDDESEGENEQDDDIEWYRKEVNQEPDQDLFPKKRKVNSSDKRGKSKKVKNDETEKDSKKKVTSFDSFLKRKKKRKLLKLKVKNQKINAYKAKIKGGTNNNKGAKRYNRRSR